MLSALYFASKISIEEDISKAAPGEDERLNLVLKNLKTTDKLIINISLADTTAASDPEKLIAFADELVDSVNSTSFTPFIKNITGKMNDSLMSDVIEIFYDHLPVFLSNSNYAEIDSLISERNVEKSLNNDYKTLLSPTSFIVKKFIRRDPIGISSLAYNKLKKLQFDESYDMQDGYVFTKDRKHLLLFIDPAYPANKTSENAEFIDKLDKLLLSFQEKNNSIQTEYFGAIAVAVGNAKQIKKDVLLSVIISLLIIMLFVAWYFRRISIPFISFLPAVFGSAIALTIVFLFKANISVIALAIGSVLLGIIVDYALYIFSLRKIKDSVEEVLRDMSLTIFLCALTTAVAFFSLLFVKSAVLRDLGLFAGISVLGAALFSLVFLPHLMKPKKKLSNDKKRITVIDKIATYSFESNKILVLLIVIISAWFLYTSNKTSFEKDMYKMSYLSDKLSSAEKNLNRANDISLRSVYLVSLGKNLDEALTNNEKNSVKLDKLQKQNIIIKYSTVSSVIIDDSMQEERLDKWNSYWNANKKSKLKEIIIKKSKKLGFTREAFTEFYNLLDKDFRITSAKNLDKLISIFFNDRITNNPDVSMVVSLVKVDGANREKVFSAFSGDKNVVIFDKQKITANFVNDIKTDFNMLVNLCLIFVTIVLIVAFGRIEIGLIASVPMFVSWLWTLGIMGAFGLSFNIFNILISTFIFGLGVDYSILMIRGLLMDYKYGSNQLPSYKTSVLLSSITTIVGVGVLILAKHPALHSIAFISVFGLLSVVLISYTIEPILFRYLTYKKSKKRVVPMTFSDLIFTVIAFSIFIFGCLSMNIILPFILILPVSRKAKKLIMHYFMMGFCRLEVYAMFNIKKRIVNIDNANFKKPSLIIANHQSHIDLLLLLMLHPKIIVVTNNWVWNNPIYSLVIRYLDFYPANNGYENLIERLRRKIDEGYSVLVFPEGSRSDDMKIKRFHKGAFLIAEQLNLEVLPIVIHGVGDCMTKGENFLKNGAITIKIFPRINNSDRSFGNDYSELTKSVLKYVRSEYDKMIEEYNTPKYCRKFLIKNYLYKGPILEWYARIKIKLDGNYELFNSYIPTDAEVTDIGCGYGFLAYMLNFVSEKRKITGIDHDYNKIELAKNCNAKNDNVNFVCANALTYEYKNCDVIILSDILHYLTEDKQEQLIKSSVEHLNPGGLMIIRDADSDLKKRHWGTKYTEFFSTRSGFNKMGEKKLTFMSGKNIKEIISGFGLEMEIIDKTRFTSNIVYIIRNIK
jgi:1-acyl-sn-glycerol-3-phosphate acyltransferase